MALTRLRQLVMTVLGDLRDAMWLPILLARLVIGVEFFLSGKGKLGSLDALISSFESWGIPLAHVQAPFVATIELVGGLCLVLGLGSRIFSALLTGVMSVAILVTLTQEGVTILPHDTLANVLYLPEVGFLVIFVWLVFSGPGKISCDHIIAPKLGLTSAVSPER
ncbi:DoxX family protein [Acidobacteria bacterium AH-259-A15]|nr:DoxX family protein [Acidobacteria bacterium AH-259-A15]